MNISNTKILFTPKRRISLKTPPMTLKRFEFRYLILLASFLTFLFFACGADDGPEEDRTPPTVPGGLKALDITDSSILVSWDPSGDNIAVTGYVIYQNDVQVSNDSRTSYRATDLLAETKYTYKVRSVDAAGNTSGFTPEIQATTLKKVPEPDTDTTAPTTPTDLIVLDSTQTTIDLSWSAATDSVGVVVYRVFQDSVLIATIEETEFQVAGTDYQVTNLSPNTEYQFTVSAVDAAGNESEQSNLVAVTTLVDEEPPTTIDKILVFTKTVEFRHSSIAKGVSTLQELGQANNFEITQTENAADFTLENLQQYQTVVFLSTTGDVLNDAQQAAFESYIRGGGNFMGIHSATDTEYDWPWYGQLVGAYFDGHTDIKEAVINLVDNNHPSTSQLPDPWTRTDEWYNFRDINSNINVLLNLDESSYTGGTNGSSHPIAWYHEFDGGRSFYTGGGHSDANYDEPDFRQHLLGGILYSLGR